MRKLNLLLTNIAAMRRVLWVSLGTALMSVAMIGCASTPPRALTEQLAKTDASIEQARQAGAASGGLPELQTATDKRARAQEEIEQHHYDIAMHLAQQAQLDAQFASRKSQADKAISSAAELQRSNEALRVEAERKAIPSDSSAPTSTD